ncbi:MAG: hypothetical protein A2015_04840 [Spirochaetes bacterium GWF1_31_7]|nr:MAG: hypothetical protein A2Y30_05220 [Spirochaetes bacterium GWE1_32_154]OHD48794.1 MAG: hypothetical protein A2Y29_03200 [Spirochaetes bacterium GWE2_31_10]OHD52857.1 MAG: hypothetical protein A2015_04840 [Spirochaetes bacterium GWF1_31_7]OHD77215.1 MAG: hypothetical protein A2355_08780 [Spirochaetes bacterium RIFOXYB1_FULL_32_8]HBD93143.1 hypothetical protein [Spirochaetia bacterium]
MKNTLKFLQTALVLITLSLSSCTEQISNETPANAKTLFNPAETFTETDAPVTETIQEITLTTPWGYARTTNATRNYPLVVVGSWGEGTTVSQKAGKKYPAFFLDFNNKSSETDGAFLAELIDNAVKSNYRIDTNRIYLTDFSMGGSGSFKVVRGMLSKEKLFAAIIRVAGQSESTLADQAVSKTSIWYHIGLNDTQVRVDVARETYTKLKNHTTNSGAIETITTDNSTGFSRETKTLRKDGVDIVKYSEYQGVGHDPGPCYKDEALFDWLFNQSLTLR